MGWRLGRGRVGTLPRSPKVAIDWVEFGAGHAFSSRVAGSHHKDTRMARGLTMEVSTSGGVSSFQQDGATTHRANFQAYIDGFSSFETAEAVSRWLRETFQKAVEAETPPPELGGKA